MQPVAVCIGGNECLVTGSICRVNRAVCLHGNSYSVAPNCPTQFTVKGYRYVFNVGYFLSNNYAENFSATDISVNSPYNRLTANLQINYKH